MKMKQSAINTSQDLRKEMERLRTELEEARELIDAIRTGEIDALAVQGPDGPQIYSLKSADHTYRILVEGMNEGALTLNNDGIILYSNARFANFLKMPLEKVIGSSFYSYIPVDYYKLVEKILQKGWEGSSKGEIIIKERNGKFIPFSLSVQPFQFNDAPALGMIITDLSAEKEILAIKSHVELQNGIIDKKNKEILKEKEIKEEAERFRMILESIPQIAWTARPDGGLDYYNKRWYTYTGLTFEESNGWGWNAVIHPDDLKQVLDAWHHSLETGGNCETESRVKRGSDQKFRWHICRAVPMRKQNGEIFKWVGTLIDVHDQKEALEKLAEAKEQLNTFNIDLKNKNEELIKTNNDLDNFVYTASHDLKAPVSNIEGLVHTLSDVLSTDGLNNKDVKEIITLINSSIVRFKATILDLTEITKIQKLNQEDIVTQNIEDIISDVRLSINDLIVKSDARFHIDTSECLEIKFSKKNLKSIIYNLLSNAVKYRSFDKKPEIFIKTQKVDGFILLAVKDNGLGMNMTKETKIFSMFKRLHDHVDGSGIGLDIVKRIIDNAGGKIEVESEVDKGSTFKVYFKD
jgi:PAS domain S-box-containing protein